MIKADLHIHSYFSMDCSLSFHEIVSSCIQQKIDCIAICDHGTIQGALKLSRTAPFKIIVAEEISTPMGEIMGMFLTEEITSPCPVNEAIKRIKAQNGLVCVPHPADALRSSAFGLKNLYGIIDQVDIIETFNSRNHLPGGNSRADAFARRHNKLRSAGSDAHTAGEIGTTYIQMQDFVSKEDFCNSLKTAIIHGRVSNPLVHLASTRNRLSKILSKGN